MQYSLRTVKQVEIVLAKSSGKFHRITLHVPFLSDPSRAIRPCSFSHATFFSMVVELSSVSSARRTIVILGKKYNNRMMEYLFTPNFFFKGLGVFTPNFSPNFFASLLINVSTWFSIVSSLNDSLIKSFTPNFTPNCWLKTSHWGLEAEALISLRITLWVYH